MGILPFVSVSPIRAQIASQVAYATPQAAVYSLDVPFTKPEVDGDLNVLVLGWRDASAKVLAVSDSNGNQYQLAGGSATLGANLLSQSVYYCPSVNAGSDAVTVIFSQPPTNPDVRILEYSGFSALDTVTAKEHMEGFPITQLGLWG